MKYLNLPQLPVVSALPASSIAGQGRMCVLLSNLHVYCDNGTTWDDLTAQGAGGGGGGGAGLTGYAITNATALRTLNGTTATISDIIDVLYAITLDNPTSGTPANVLTPIINAQTGTSYTVLISDLGKLITLSNVAAITVTIPASLGVGFNCAFLQLNAGVPQFVGSGGTIVGNRQGHTRLAGARATGSIVAHIANDFTLSGDTAV